MDYKFGKVNTGFGMVSFWTSCGKGGHLRVGSTFQLLDPGGRTVEPTSWMPRS